MTTHLSFDNRVILPPFFPLFRGQDLTFGQLLRLAMPSALIAHLPYAVRHIPMEPRRARLEELWPPEQTCSLATIVGAALSLAASGIVESHSDAGRLGLIGSNLVALVAQERPLLCSALRRQIALAASAYIAECRVLVDKADVPHCAWARSLAAFIDHRLRSLEDLDPMIPTELRDRP